VIYVKGGARVHAPVEDGLEKEIDEPEPKPEPERERERERERDRERKMRGRRNTRRGRLLHNRKRGCGAE